MTNLHIAGLVVYCRHERRTQVLERLAALPGVEVRAAEAGKAAVTLEAETDRAIIDLVERIGQIPGVITNSLVYHHHEPLERPREEFG